jgi:hypothetical protein
MNAREDAQWVGDTIAQLQAENERLRQIISDCAAALPNGAGIAPQCSIDFMALLPGEIAACCARLARRAIEQATTSNDPANGQITSRAKP